MIKPEIVEGSPVIISNPRSFQGGTSMFLGLKGRLETRTGRYCTIVLSGELDELGFFIDEIELDTSVS